MQYLSSTFDISEIQIINPNEIDIIEKGKYGKVFSISSSGFNGYCWGFELKDSRYNQKLIIRIKMLHEKRRSFGYSEGFLVFEK